MSYHTKRIVCDLDGTLSNISKRFHLAQEGRWDEFHSLSHQDEVNRDVARILQRNHDFIILTGRPKKYLNKTHEWLGTNGLFPYAIIMRPDGDMRSDARLKPELLAQWYGGMEQALRCVDFILEDRDNVVEAFRNLGFHCWQVRQGTY